MNASPPGDKPSQDRLAGLMADMAHDIRTSLNAITGFSEIMQHDRALTLRQRERCDTINRSGKTLLGLMESLFDISRIHAGRASVDRGLFDLYNMIRDIEAQFTRKGPAYPWLRTDVASGCPQYIAADEGRIKQVLSRMVECMARELQGRDVILRVSTEERKKRKVLVCDISGNIGTRGNVSGSEEPVTRDELRRMGIVPMISGELVCLMGGTLTIGKETPGNLSCHIEIDIEENSPLKEKDAKRTAPGIAGPPENVRVLIVDGTEEDRIAAAELLSETGFEIQEAENGAEAVVQFEVFRPHIILMDLVMPALNGLKAAWTIREKADAQKTAIIAITANVSNNDERSIVEAGMNGYLIKPFDRESLLAMIAQYTGIGPLGPNGAEVSDRSTVTDSDGPGIPEELLVDLRQAARNARPDILLELTALVEDRSISERLRKFIRQYDYKSIFELLGRDNEI